MAVNDDKSKWNKVLNKDDCEVTQPSTAALCYPKSDVTNHPYTEKLFKYRALHGNKCDPSPSQPCILDHTGLVLPNATPVVPDVDIIYEPIGNDLIIRYCEDFFADNNDKIHYRSLNGSYVKETVNNQLRSFIESFYKEHKNEDSLELDRPNSFSKIKIELFKDSNDLVSMRTPDTEGLVIVLPNTYIQYCRADDDELKTQIKFTVNELANAQALTTISCYVGNNKIEEYCPGHEEFNPSKSKLFPGYESNEESELGEYIVLKSNTDNTDNTDAFKDGASSKIEKNRFRYTITTNYNIVDQQDPRELIDNWVAKYQDANTNALSLIKSSLECTYGNKPQTAYCVYPVVQPNENKGFTKPAVYGLYPDQLLKEGDKLNNGCAVLTDKLFPLESLASVAEEQTNNQKHVAYIPTKDNNFEYNYFEIDKNTGEYFATNTSTVASITNEDNAITIGVCDDPENCEYDYYFDKSFIQQEDSISTLNFKHNTDNFDGYYIDPFYSGTDNSFTVDKQSQTITYSFKEQDSDIDAPAVIDAPADIIDKVNTAAYTSAESNLVCQYGNPFYGATCPNSTELPGGSTCSVISNYEKQVATINVNATNNEELVFYLEDTSGKFYQVDKTHVVDATCKVFPSKKDTNIILDPARFVDISSLPDQTAVVSGDIYKKDIELSYTSDAYNKYKQIFVYKKQEQQMLYLGAFPFIQNATTIATIQQKINQFDICVDKQVITSTDNTAQALASVESIGGAQLEGCLIQNIEVKAFCDKIHMYAQMLEDLLNTEESQFTDWNDRIIVHYNRDNNSYTLEKNSLNRGRGIIYVYLNSFHSEEQAGLGSKYSCLSKGESIGKPPYFTSINNIDIYYDVTPDSSNPPILDDAMSIFIPIIEDNIGFYFSRSSTDVGFSIYNASTKLISDIANMTNMPSHSSFLHCAAIEPHTNSVTAGSYISKNSDDIETLNLKAISLAVSGLACLYGNAASQKFDCSDSITLFGYSIDKICSGSCSDDPGNVKGKCAYNEAARELDENIFLAEDPWKADIQALSTQLSMRVCLDCDKVGYSAGGGTSTLTTSCESACKCENSYCVFTSA